MWIIHSIIISPWAWAWDDNGLRILCKSLGRRINWSYLFFLPRFRYNTSENTQMAKSGSSSIDTYRVLNKLHKSLVKFTLMFLVKTGTSTVILNSNYQSSPWNRLLIPVSWRMNTALCPVTPLPPNLRDLLGSNK